MKFYPIRAELLRLFFLSFSELQLRQLPEAKPRLESSAAEL